MLVFTRFMGLLLLLYFTSACVGSSDSLLDVSPARIGYAVHLWGSEEDDSLRSALNSFEQISGASILLESNTIVPKSIEEQLGAGLGPDIIIGLPYEEMANLADSGLLYTLDESQVNLDSYLPQQIRALTYQGELYGLPFMAGTSVLFYNKSLIDETPTSVQDLITIAGEGHTVAIPTGFEQIFWGIPAFGGSFFDDQGQPGTTPTEFAAWFQWLTTAQSHVGIVMDDNLDLLAQKFIDGEVTFIVAPTDTFNQLAEGIGEHNLGAIPIPGVEYTLDTNGTGEPLIRNAGPLLNLQVIAFNKAANKKTIELGLELAEFLNNPTVQRKLILAGARHSPTNFTVFIRPDLSEVGNAYVRQSRTGVVVPLDVLAQFKAFGRLADTVYTGLLSGGMTPEEAADKMSTLFFESIEGN